MPDAGLAPRTTRPRFATETCGRLGDPTDSHVSALSVSVDMGRMSCIAFRATAHVTTRTQFDQCLPRVDGWALAGQTCWLNAPVS